MVAFKHGAAVDHVWGTAGRRPSGNDRGVRWKHHRIVDGHAAGTRRARRHGARTRPRPSSGHAARSLGRVGPQGRSAVPPAPQPVSESPPDPRPGAPGHGRPSRRRRMRVVGDVGPLAAFDHRPRAATRRRPVPVRHRASADGGVGVRERGERDRGRHRPAGRRHRSTGHRPVGRRRRPAHHRGSHERGRRAPCRPRRGRDGTAEPARRLADRARRPRTTGRVRGARIRLLHALLRGPRGSRDDRPTARPDGDVLAAHLAGRQRNVVDHDLGGGGRHRCSARSGIPTTSPRCCRRARSTRTGWTGNPSPTCSRWPRFSTSTGASSSTDRPIATGVAAVGDAWACTNPSAGPRHQRRLVPRAVSARCDARRSRRPRSVRARVRRADRDQGGAVLLEPDPRRQAAHRGDGRASRWTLRRRRPTRR